MPRVIIPAKDAESLRAELREIWSMQGSDEKLIKIGGFLGVVSYWLGITSDEITALAGQPSEEVRA